MTPFSLSGLMAGVSALFFGILVLLKSPNKPVKWTWFIFKLSAMGWGFGGLWIGFTKSPEAGLLAWRCAYAFGVIWIAPLFYHFICVFLELQRRKLIIAQYMVGFFFLIFIPTPLFFHHADWVFDSFFYARGGALYPYFAAWWFGLVIISHIDMIRVFRHAPPLKHNQIKYFFVATAVGYLGGGSAYFPNFGIDIYPWGNFTVSLYPLIMTYAILRYRLWDLRVLLQAISRYLLSAGTLGLIFGFLVMFITSSIPMALGTLVLVMSSPFLQQFLEKWLLETKSRRGLLDASQAGSVRSLPDRIQEAGNTVSDLGDTVTKLMFDELPVARCGIFIYDHEAGNYFLQSKIGLEKKFYPRFDPADPLIVFLKEKPDILVLSEARLQIPKKEYEAVSGSLVELEIEVCAPLMIGGGLAGFIVLGPKTNHMPFYVNDTNRVQEIASETRRSLRYALGRLEDISKTRKWAHTLYQSLKPLKSAFTYFKNTDAEFRSNPDKMEVYDQIHKVIGRLNSFFTYLVHTNRIESEAQKNTYETKPVRISALLKDTMEEYKHTAKRKNIGTAVDIEDTDVNIWGHAVDLKSVFESIVNNAFRYVSEGGRIQIQGSETAKGFQISIYNDGPSIPEQHHGDIFKENFQIRDGYQGAGGLGLANAKKIVELHNGSIKIENGRGGSGVNFIIKLPIKDKDTERGGR